MMFENRKLNTCITIKINEQEINRVCLVKSKLPKCAIVYSASFLIDRSDMSIVYHSLFLPYIVLNQALMQQRVHKSSGRVKFVMDRQEFEKTGITHLSMVMPVLLRLYDGL